MQNSQELFKYPPAGQQIENESSEKYEILEMGTDMQGESLLVKIKDGMFPLKNMVFANTLFGANMVKSIVMESIKIFSKPYFLPGLLITNKQYLLDRFNYLAFKICSDKILKYKHWSKFGKEFHSVLNEFLWRCGFEEKSCDRFAEIIVFLIDCDNAYRLRIEDLFSETSKRQLIENPRKEILRLTKILEKRELCPVVVKKFTSLAKILTLLLLIPKYKRAFKQAIQNCELSNLQLDLGDAYWSVMRHDYQFMGMTFEERQNYGKLKQWSFPKQEKQIMKKINEQQIQAIMNILGNPDCKILLRDYIIIQDIFRLLPTELPKIPDVIEEVK